MKRKLLIIFLLVTSVIFFSRLFIARRIECFTQYGPCPDDINSRLEPLKHSSLLAPLPVKKADHLLAGLPNIQNFSLYRRFPSTLVAVLTLRKPLAMISSDSQILGVADITGTIWNPGNTLALPNLELNSPANVLSGKQLKSLEHLSQAEKIMGAKITGRIEGPYLTILSQTWPKIILGIDQEINQWYPPLQEILTRSRISPRVPLIIDLRFTHPIISYQ